ncbi:MAG TPA: helix-turn-helix transcriptional regulator [Saprospiraceae bacterium]|nr:helix-turn-helix transcriptional regulator [Saprospiraceae bacterium]HMQ83395.1 helix-turn-helix transcriptional regulator [Saprospiraceae bacterium]
MKTFRELLATDTYWVTKIQNDLFNAVEDYLKSQKMTRTQFAEQLGVSKGYISQVLNGEFNHRLSKLVELALAIQKAPVLEFENLEEVMDKEAKGMIRTKACYVPRAPFQVQIKNGELVEQKFSTPHRKQSLTGGIIDGHQGKWEMKEMVKFRSSDLC